ncbi:hypothetical protein OS493_019998 [Desmophyllum pertusum]|uniref:Transmembrane protein 168 n=1 Tax=Desmophyllum pertusum TaxID=174260 RepID=A0A9W9YBD0_9CNID|nr:hypothetical protein OS493_019998 [Desmophyllum pertusum]
MASENAGCTIQQMEAFIFSQSPLPLAVLISLSTYLYGYRDFGRGFGYLWMGVLFSVLSFTEIAFDHLIDSLHDLDVTDILIMASTGVNCFKVLTERICSSPAYESMFLATEECLFLLGFLSGTTGTMHFGNMLTIIAAVTIHLMAFHMKSSSSLLSAFCLCFLGSARGELSDNSMSDVMASKGLRHFCLVSQIVSLYTLLSTFLVIASAWQETNPVFIGMLLIILPVELLIYDILTKLGKSVGGTAIGYAVVAPAHKYSPTGDVIFLAENAFQAIFSTSGISADYIEKKITSFFEQRVLPGLHYDTYILYYSGHVTINGDWALTEGRTLSFESILKWWRNTNAATGARLLLFLDTAHSDKWVDNIWKVENDFVAIQTGKLTATFDTEQGNTFPLGELTKLWDDFNTTSAKPENYWDKNSMKVKPVYGVSREWCCFKFHEPTVKDIAQHVEQNFPRFIKPITKIFTHLPCNTNVLSMFDWFTNGCRRLKMRWFPPAVYDTGHGFKLVR